MKMKIFLIIHSFQMEMKISLIIHPFQNGNENIPHYPSFVKSDIEQQKSEAITNKNLGEHMNILSFISIFT